MNFNQLKLASLLASLTFLIALSAVFLVVKQDNTLETGKLFVSPEIIFQTAEINIITPNTKVTLIPEEHLWKIKESDYYYADFNLVHSLINSLKTAKITNKQEFTTDLAQELQLLSSPKTSTLSGSRIILKNSAGQEIDNIIIGKSTVNKDGVFSKRPNDTSIYTIDTYIDFPQQLTSWTSQPFIALAEKDIQKFSLKQSTYSRPDKGTKFQKQKGTDLSINEITQILKKFQYLPYEEVISAQNFDDTLYPNRITIALTDFEGLVHNIEILTDNNTYWVKQTFSTTPLPTHHTNDYIQNNTILYDGWYFKLSPSDGREIYSYVNR